MALAGYLAEYSLAEIFNFVHEGNITGLLSISIDPNSDKNDNSHYLWFETGRIVAVTSDLNGTGLLKTISQRKLMSSAQLELLGSLIRQLPQPLGVYLQSRGLFDIELLGSVIHEIPQTLGLYLKSYQLLDAEQLKLLFNTQTITSICKMFELKNGKFRFELDRRIPNSELTGLSLPAQEVGLLGLRYLKDWSGLSDKLLDPDYAISKVSSQVPSVKLDRNELQLWKLADGKTSLTQLSVKLDLSIDVVRQIVFRLSTFRIVKEVSIKSLPVFDSSAMSVPISAPGYKNPAISNSFLGNLRGFLKKGNQKSPQPLNK